MPIPSFPQPDHTIPAAPGVARRPKTFSTLTYEPSSRRVRAVLGDTAIVDSAHQILVWEADSTIPEYAYPVHHVRMDLLQKGAAPEKAYWRPKGNVEWYDLVLGDTRVPAAAWTWPDLGGWIALSWYPPQVVWYEEDEVVFVHPRSPYARVDAIPSSRAVRVLVGGEVIAESSRAVAVFETGLPTRFYLPPSDVVWDKLMPVDLKTSCPYKGTADKYWRTTAGKDGIAWSYSDPTPQVAAIKGLVGFYNEKVTLVVDGVPFEDSPKTWA